jgi:ribonucleoside-diphosphate reductase beta chain
VGIKIINTLREEYPELFDTELEERILSEARESIKAESIIIDWMVGNLREENVSPDILKEFIKNRMNQSLQNIGFKSIFDIDQELLSKTTWFDEELLGNNMTDFFHTRPVEYSKKGHSFSESDLF